ncbi:MAG: hypothetical protein U0797_10880 [Gemmataceae bacterium]
MRPTATRLKIDGQPIASSLKAPKTESLTPGRCLSSKPGRGVPSFGFDDEQRKAIKAGLAANPPPATPRAVVAETMTTFNCYACHVRDKVGGREELNRLFLTTSRRWATRAGCRRRSTASAAS